MQSVAERIGITSSIAPEGYARLIEHAASASFPVFELVLGDSASPEPLWPSAMSPGAREKLRLELEPFRQVIVRATCEDINVASINPGQRVESERQSLECMLVAAEVGAAIVVLQSGTQTYGFVSNPKDVVARNVDFAYRALEAVAGNDIAVAFKMAGFSADDAAAILEQVDDPRFGLDLCIGDITALTGVPTGPNMLTDNICSWIKAFAPRIKVVHLSGVHQRWHTERLAGCPLEMDNCVDHRTVIHSLRRAKCEAPIVLEIRAGDACRAIAYCQTARDRIIGYWDGGR